MVLIFAYAILACGFLVAHPALADVAYTYDDLGRIKTVRSATGDIAEYVYDAVGNILEVRTVATGTLVVTGFTPTSGPAQINVTISGSGFSTTPAANTVKFNTTVATVLWATANSIVTTVPTGATTGPISVTVGTATATSRDTFAVTSSAGRLAPTITDFTPKIGPAGTAVTVTGTNFDTVVDATRTSLNGTQAKTTVASTTSLTLTVPAKAASGKISATTIAGLATSAVDFIVPPTGIAPAAIVATARANLGQTATVAINASNKYGLVLVDGYQGNYLSLDLTTFTVSPSTATISYTVYAPDNTIFVQGKTVSATDRSIHLPLFVKTGTYSVAFNSGAATATLGVQPTSASPLSPGYVRPLSTIFAGQSVRLSFPGAIGDSLGMEIAGMGTTPAGQTVNVTVYNPDGTVFVPATTVATVGKLIQLPVLSVAGVYTIIVDPAGTALATLKLTLETGTALSLNGPAVNGSIATAGEAMRYVYNAPVNLPVQVNISALQLSGGADATVTVYKPNGTVVASVNCPGAAGGCAIGTASQSFYGPFSIVVQPANGATGTVSASITATNGIVGALNPGAPFAAVVPQGSAAYYTFSAAAGESPSVFLQFTPNSGYLETINIPKYIKVYRPDGTLLLDGPATYNTAPTGIKCNGTTGNYTTACSVQLTNLPVSGTYTVLVQPFSLTGMNVTVTATLYREATFTLSSGTSVPTILAPAQNAVYQFTTVALSSPVLSLAFSPNSGYVGSSTLTPRYLKVYKPDGTLLADGPVYGSTINGISCNNPTTLSTVCTISMNQVPQTGAYKVVVQPYTVTGTNTVTATVNGLK